MQMSSYLSKVALFALAYYVTGRLGLLLAVPPGYATAMWPPSGFALAGILILGYRYWPGVLLGSFAVNLFTSFDPSNASSMLLSGGIAVIIAGGATLQATVSAWLCRRWIVFPNVLEQTGDIGLLLTLGGPVGCLINSFIGVGTLTVFGLIPLEKSPFSWLTWWVGDTIGVLVFTPIVLLISNKGAQVSNQRKKVAGTVLVGTFALTVAIFIGARDSEHKRQLDSFERKASLITTELDDKFLSYRDAIYGVTLLYRSSQNVDPDEFRIFAAGVLERHPGMRGLTWAPKIRNSDRQLFEAAQRRQGFPGFRIMEQAGRQLVAAAQRDVYFPVTYIEPFVEELRGFDNNSEAIRRRTLEKALDQGTGQATPRLSLIQREKDGYGMLLFRPIYQNGKPANTVEERRRNIEGFIVGAFILPELIAASLKNIEHNDVEFYITDDDSPLEKQLLYDSRTVDHKESQTALPSHPQDMHWQRQISVAGRSWTIHFIQTQAMLLVHQNWTVWLVLAGGLLFTGLSGVFIMMFSARTDIVRRLVEQRTQQLKRSQEATELLRSIAVDASEVRTVEALIHAVLESVCDYVHWPVGHAYRYDPDKKWLASTRCWHMENEATFSLFREISERNEFVSGIDLPGRVLRERKPVWIENVAVDGNFPRAKEMAPTGLRAAFAFPVLVKNEVSLVLEFFSVQALAPDPDLLALLDGISAQLSRAIERTLVEQELHKREVRHQQLVDGVQDYAIYWLDLLGNVESWNTGAERITGYAAKEIIGQHFSKFYTTDDCKDGLPQKVLDTVLVSGRFEDEGWRVRKDGSRFWASIAIAALHDHQGMLTGFAKVIRDITERSRVEQALKASEESFRLAMEHASIGMALVDVDGRWLKVNDALCKLIGYSEQELVRIDFQSITHQEDVQTDLEYVRQMLAGAIQTYQMEKRYLHKDGHTIWVLLSVSLVRNADDSPKYFVSQIQDITQRREMDRVKSEFISTVSHELRTPLTSIRGSLGLIVGGAAGVLPEKTLQLLQVAFRNTDRLTLLINDILDIEQVDSGKLSLDLAEHPLSTLIEQVVEANRSYAQNCNVEFVIRKPLPRVSVIADAHRFAQVLANLLSNAAKFSPPRSVVEISVTTEDARCRVAVKDCGPGIPEEFRARIFQRFSQADSSDKRAKGGTGLGLAISKALIEQMGGTIGYASTPGAGAIFYFELPRPATTPTEASVTAA
jgi:PAS domain S-box-containing protein